MESLALVVSVMLLGEVLLGVATIVFAVLVRFKGKFARTSLVLISVLAVEAVWALSILPAFGFPPLFALLIAVLLRWWHRRGRTSFGPKLTD